MRRLLPLAAALAVTFQACSYAGQSRRNILATTGQGTAMDIADRREFSDEELHYSIEAIIDNIDATAPIRNGKKQVLIYIHGGLAKYNTSISTADKIRQPIEDAGYYPVFFVWASNLGTAYLEHLLYVRQGRRREIAGPLTSPFILVGDLLEGIIHAPGTYYEQLATFVSSLGKKLGAYESNVNIREQALLGSQADSLTLIKGEDHQSGWDRTGRFLAYIITLAPKLLLMPIVDGFGEPAFEDMKRRTRVMFRQPGEFQAAYNELAVDLDEIREHGSGTGAAALFLSALNARIAERDDIEITLIGFSMGTIVTNHIVRDYPSLPIRNIVYMAAACTIQDFRDSVVPFMRLHQTTRFYNVALHPKAESREAQWRFLDLPPRGTLLDWVDNFLSSPETEADRTMGKWNNIILASHMIPADVRSRVVLKCFDGASGDVPQTHGDFDDFPFWEPSFWGR